MEIGEGFYYGASDAGIHAQVAKDKAEFQKADPNGVLLRYMDSYNPRATTLARSQRQE
jgi:hypothetical protein